jgi:hypothetical protein
MDKVQKNNFTRYSLYQVLWHSAVPASCSDESQDDPLVRGPWLSGTDPLFIHRWQSDIGIHLTLCRTVSRHTRRSKWSPPASMHNWTLRSKLANTPCDMSTGTAAVSWRMLSLRASMVRGLFVSFPFRTPHKKKCGGSVWEAFDQRSFETTLSPKCWATLSAQHVTWCAM